MELWAVRALREDLNNKKFPASRKCPPFLSLSPMQRCQDYFAYTIKKDLPIASFLTYQAFNAEKELFVEQILLSDLRLDTFVMKNTNLTNLFDWYRELFQKTAFRSNKSQHCAYIIYSVKTRFFKTCFDLK